MNAAIQMSDLLNALDNDELDHLSLGLEHNFGVTLCGNAGESDFHLLACGKVIALDKNTINVGDVWNVAKKISPL